MARGGTTNTIRVAVVAGGYFFAPSVDWLKSPLGAATTTANAQGAPPRLTGAAPGNPLSVELSDKQLASVKVEPVGEREFPIASITVAIAITA